MSAPTSPRRRWKAAPAAAFCGSGLLAAACAFAIGAPAWTADAPSASGVRSFILSNVSMGVPEEPGACEPLSDGGLQTFFKSLSPEEQAKYPITNLHPLQKLMNQRWGYKSVRVEPALPEVTRIVREKGGKGLPPDLAARVAELRRLSGAPPGKGMINNAGREFAYDSCTNPEDFPQAVGRYKPYDGKLALGVDLDGKADRNDYVSPSGAKGVDNQLWRAIGCIKIFREQGASDAVRSELSSPLAPTLVELRGVDSLRDDPEVEVAVYGAAGPIALDARGHALRRASYDVSDNPQLRARTKGRIVGGELVTEPFDVTLSQKVQILDVVRDLRQTRLIARFTEDGGIEGGFYGYYTVESFWEMLRQFTVNGADQTQISCPGLRAAVERYADGVRDPRTGRYTALSTALSFVGAPAYALHGADDVKVAQRGGTRP
jgi:hypothetical protein